MTVVEIVLIVVGLVFMIGSFFVTEKLSQKEVAQISELSSAEMKRIMEKNLDSAENQVKDRVEEVIDRSFDQVERAMQRETNLKIKDISEYSETVMESIHKNHDEVMFLYSMLNDKHADMTASAGKLEKLGTQLKALEEEVTQKVREYTQMIQNMYEQALEVSERKVILEEEEEKAKVQEQEQKQEQESPESKEEEIQNRNMEILNLYRQKMNVVEIARKLGMGVGEVQLVLGLYRKGEV